MKKIQDRFQHKRNGAPLRGKRLLIGNDYTWLRIDAYTLADAARISVSHAYRLIDNPELMTDTVRELVEIKLLGLVPSWPPGWSFRDGRLWSPNGVGYYPNDVESIGLERQLQQHTQKDNERLQAELKRANKMLAAPRELRVYVNDEVKPRRVLKVGCKDSDQKTA